MKLEPFFHRHPVFTTAELASFLSTRGTGNVRTRESLVAYHVRRGRLLRVRRGLFAVVPPGSDPATYPVDAFLLAGKMADDAILAHHTALEFHGKSHSVQERLVYLSGRRVRPSTFRTLRFEAVPFPRALRAAGREREGVVTAERAGVGLSVTTLERTLVDVLDRPDLSGSWEEIWRSLEAIEFFDLDRVIEYAALLGNAATAAKVGLFLEQHREALMVPGAALDRLRKLRPGQPRHLDPARGKVVRLVAGWNLLVPAEILDRTWAEMP